jgi:WD40 repeat protein
LLPEGRLLLQTVFGFELLTARGQTSESSGPSLSPLDLSPDGASVLAEANGALVAVDIATGNRSVLVQPPSGDALEPFAEWSPNGQRVAYSVGGPDPEKRSTLCVVEVTSHAARCLPQAGEVLTFDWSPDGQTLVVAGPLDQPIELVNVITGHVSRVVSQGGSTSINREIESAGLGRADQLVAPSWSPSGRYLAALARLRNSKFFYVPVVFTLKGKPVVLGRASGEFPEPFAWSPVRDLLAYTQGEAPYRITEAYLLDPATGLNRKLVSSGGRPYPMITDMVWSPSGRWLALALWRPSSALTVRILDVATGRSTQFRISADVAQALVGWASAGMSALVHAFRDTPRATSHQPGHRGRSAISRSPEVGLMAASR